MKHSIYIRHFLATTLIVLVSFTILGGLSTMWNYRRAMSDRRLAMTSTLQETARYLTAQNLYDEMELGDLNLSMWLAIISGVSGFDMLITDVDGIVSACSDGDFSNLGEIIPESDLALALKDNTSVTLSTLGRFYPDFRQVAGMPLITVVNGEPYASGYLFISSDLASFRREWRQFSNIFALIALSVMVLAFVVSLITTKKEAEPLNEMAGAARRFARGDFATRVKDTGRHDEIGQLAQAFNAMADSLESSETLRQGFIANLSHELKTPMTVIDGFTEGILDGTIPQKDAERYLKVILSETRRLSRLVGSMLNMSRLQSSNVSATLRSSFDVSEVVRLALLSLEGKIYDRRLDVDAEIPEEPILARGDSDSFTQVVYNLIDNAIKFSAPGGVIKIELWKQGDRAFVSVENSGETIPPDDIAHIFERFHKADKSRSADREGVGLGLYIVKTILDNFNEDIFVTSSAGITKFVFTLTIAQ